MDLNPFLDMSSDFKAGAFSKPLILNKPVSLMSKLEKQLNHDTKMRCMNQFEFVVYISTYLESFVAYCIDEKLNCSSLESSAL
jgi:hypothetical protein